MLSARVNQYARANRPVLSIASRASDADGEASRCFDLDSGRPTFNRGGRNENLAESTPLSGCSASESESTDSSTVSVATKANGSSVSSTMLSPFVDVATSSMAPCEVSSDALSLLCFFRIHCEVLHRIVLNQHFQCPSDSGLVISSSRLLSCCSRDNTSGSLPERSETMSMSPTRTIWSRILLYVRIGLFLGRRQKTDFPT